MSEEKQIPENVTAIVTLIARLERAFAEDYRAKNPSPFTKAQIKQDEAYGDFTISYEELSEKSSLKATLNFLSEQARLRTINGIYEYKKLKKKTGTDYRETGTWTIETFDVFGSFDSCKFYIRPEDLIALEQVCQIKINALAKGEVTKEFLAAVQPIEIIRIMDFKTKLDERSINDLKREAETADQIGNNAVINASFNNFLSSHFTAADNEGILHDKDKAALLQETKRRFIESRKLETTMRELDLL